MVKMWEHTTGLPDTVSWMAHIQDGDGNTFVTGNTIVSGDKANILTTKYDRLGDEIWQVTYNSSYDDNDYGTAITIDADGNVYVAATSYTSATNQYDYRAIKYDSTGTLQWTSTYNGTGSLYDIPSDILVDDGGNVYVTGGSYGSGTGWDYATVKYNSSGTQQWVSRYNYNDNDDAASGLAINSSGRILVKGGSAQAPDNWDFASVKYNQGTGAQLDVQRNTATGLGIDRVYGFAIDAEDNIYLTGRAAITGEGYNIRTVKMDSMLTVQWNKQYDAADSDDAGYAVKTDVSGNVYVTGSITNAENIQNGITIKYNSAGTLQWAEIETANNGKDLDTWNMDMSLNTAGEIIVCGISNNGANSDMILYIYDSEGEKQWTETWNNTTANGDDTPYFVHADINNQIYIGGKTWNGTSDTYILIRYKRITYTTPPDDDTDKPIQLAWFENRGQIIDTDENIRSDIKYYTQRHYPALYASDDSLFMVFSRIDTNTTTDDTLARIDIGYYNSSSAKEIHHATSNGGEYLNYFLAHTGANGITNVQQHEKLYITELYPKVDLMYYFDNAGIKYYLIIHPGYSAQNNPIQMVINGATKTINPDTTLTLTTDIGEITFRTPDAYQIDDDGSRIDLAWNATYTNVSGRIGFGLGSYTNSKILVLEIGTGLLIGSGGECEPNVIWGTFYSASNSDILTDVKINSADYPALYIAGCTESSAISFPSVLNYLNNLTGSEYDIFIQKFNLDESFLTLEKYEPQWAVFIGGSNSEYLTNSKNTKIAINESAEGNGKKIYFAGLTYSNDLPVIDNDLSTLNFYDDEINSSQDGLIGMITSEGYLNWLTYLGGDLGITRIYGIDILLNDHIVLVGQSRGGEDFPFYEADGTFPFSSSYANGTGFILELDKFNIPKMGTLFGSGSILDVVYDVTADNAGNYFICGQAVGGSLNVVNAWQEELSGLSDIFIAKIELDGDNRNLDWCTYYGGLGYEHGYANTVDEDNNVYITGITQSIDIESDEDKLPLISGTFFDDIFGDDYTDFDGYVLKLDSDGDALWATLFGGDEKIYPRDISNNGDNIFITGYVVVCEANFPFFEPDLPVYFDDTEGTASTTFLSMFNKSTELLWSTFIGDDASNNGYALTINPLYAEELYVVGSVSVDFPYTDFLPLCDPGGDSYFDDYGITGNDAFIVGFDISAIPSPPLPVANAILNESIILIYPNPAFSTIIINSEALDLQKISIFDLMGNICISILPELGINEMNISNLSDGLYFILAESQNKVYQGSFIKL